MNKEIYIIIFLTFPGLFYLMFIQKKFKSKRIKT